MIWYDRPETLRSAVLVLKQYVGPEPRMALTSRQMKRATKLLGVHGEDGRWTVQPWVVAARLKLAGLDPNTCEVADEVRWSHAIDYMRSTETFKEFEFARWLEEHDEPSSVPARDVPARPHPMARKRKKNAVNDQINERIRKIST